MKTKKTSHRKSVSIENILVPIDFSGRARLAVDYAVSIAKKFKAQIVLMHVVEPIVYPAEMGIIPTHEDTANKASIKELTSLARKSVPTALRGKPLVKFGRPQDEIIEAARRLKADLIIITTHGYTGLERVLLGSTAESVVRHAPCPVMTVRKR